MTKQEITTKVKEWLKEKGNTQEKLIRYLKISRSTLYLRIEGSAWNEVDEVILKERGVI